MNIAKALMAQTSLPRRSILGLGAGLALTACVGGQAKPIRIGYQRFGLLLVAKALGRVEKGLSDKGFGPVEWVEFPSGPPLLEAMAAGAVDFGVTGDAPPIFAEAAGARLQYVAAEPLSGAAEALLVRRGSPVRTLADLKGKTIGYTKGSSSHMFIVQALQQHGLGLDAIRSVYLSPTDAVTAFAKGDIDAWAVWDPFFAIAERDEGARVILTRASTPASGDFFLASDGFITDRPQALSALLDLLKIDGEWAEAHKPEAAKIIARSSGLPEDIALKGLKRDQIFIRPVSDADIAAQQQRSKIFTNLGLIPKKIDVEKVVWRQWHG